MHTKQPYKSYASLSFAVTFLEFTRIDSTAGESARRVCAPDRIFKERCRGSMRPHRCKERKAAGNDFFIAPLFCDRRTDREHTFRNTSAHDFHCWCKTCTWHHSAKRTYISAESISRLSSTRQPEKRVNLLEEKYRYLLHSILHVYKSIKLPPQNFFQI